MPRRPGAGRKGADRDLVARYLSEGLEPRDVADRMGITDRTVLRIRHELGLPIGPAPDRRRLTEDDHRIIRACLEEGMPYSEISRTHGYTHQTLARHYPGRGMPARATIELALATRSFNQALRKQRIPVSC
ncbi:helix-turn-helix DNA binding domain protein [Arthrobacter phage Altadena]|uniref:Helix-turn-helix DNA binding domain protein n=1 Tax=Arthrobacter phage Altadena TaxID=3059064 RepID=A0AA96HTN9_9CAUD|nr:helix-turn-helix DNA binding domain protein [Arthrobacter phage Altadena]